MRILVNLLVESKRSKMASRKRKLCPHCGEHLSRTSYYEHKARFYSQDMGCWTSETDREDDQTWKPRNMKGTASAQTTEPGTLEAIYVGCDP